MPTMRRKLLLLALVILLPLGTVSCFLSDLASLPQRATQSVADLSQSVADLSKTVADQKSSMSTAEADAISTLDAQESASSTAIAEVQATSSAQEASLQSAAEAFSTATQVAAENSAEIERLSNQSATQAVQIEDYNNSIRCLDRPASIDFTSNATVSASLKSWLETTSEDINSADWEVIWDGTESAIHRFEGEYYYVYIVYFDEPENYYYASIYDVYMHCFIYP